MADDIDRMILEDLATAALEKIQREAEETKKELRELNQELLAGKVAQNVYAQESVAAATKLQGLNQQLKAAETAQRQAGAASGSLTSTLTTLSYAANDADQFNVSFAAGIRSLSNNIPALVSAGQNLAQVGFKGVITALSGPAGLIFGVTALASLVPLIINHWSDLEDAFGLGGTRTEAEEMERLGKATEKTAEETAKLAKYKREQAEAEKLGKAEAKSVTEARSAATEALAEFPGGFEGAAQALQREREKRNPRGLLGRLSDEEIREAYSAIPAGQYAPGAFEAKREEVRQELVKKAREREVEAARGDLAEANLDPTARARLLDELRRTPALGGLTEKLEAATPEARAKKKAADEEAKQAERDQEDAIAEDEAESKRRLAARKRAQEQRTAELAKNLGPTLDREALEGGRIDKARVTRALIESQGLSAADAGRLADPVGKALGDNFRERLRTFAGDKGIPLAQAGPALLAEQKAKEAEEEKRRADKARREIEAEFKERVAKAEEQGAGDVAKKAAEAGAGRTQIGEILRRLGLSGDVADFEAEKASTAQRRAELVKGLEGEKARNVEVIGGDFINKIQAGVGGSQDVAQKSLREQQEATRRLGQLVELASQPGRGGLVLRR